MNKPAVYFSTLFLIISFFSCSNDNEDDLMPTPDPITYTNDVKAIIDNNCLNCHADPPTNGAPVSLINYDQVRNSTEIGTLLLRIQAQPGATGAMPAGGPRLSQSLIDVVVQWQQDGYLE